MLDLFPAYRLFPNYTVPFVFSNGVLVQQTHAEQYKLYPLLVNRLVYASGIGYWFAIRFCFQYSIHED